MSSEAGSGESLVFRRLYVSAKLMKERVSAKLMKERVSAKLMKEVRAKE